MTSQGLAKNLILARVSTQNQSDLKSHIPNQAGKCGESGDR
jgi:hypothetical protein